MWVWKDIMDLFTDHFKIMPAPNLCVYKQTLHEQYMLLFLVTNLYSACPLYIFKYASHEIDPWMRLDNSNLTQHMNKWNEAWSPHWELHAILLMNCVWVLLHPTGLCGVQRVVGWGPRFIVLLHEDLKVKALISQRQQFVVSYFKTLSVLLTRVTLTTSPIAA